MDAPAPFTLRPVHVPVAEVSRLSNGLEVHVVHRGPLPLIALRLSFRGGSVLDGPGRSGRSDFMARLLRRGAGALSAVDIAEQVDFVAASLSGYASEETVGVAMAVPTRHFSAMLELLGTVLREPTFPEAEVELNRRRTLSALTNELDDPSALADRALTLGVWGDHPYGQETQGTRADVEKLTRQAVVGTYQERIAPRLGRLFLVGEVPPDALQQVERVLGSFQQGPAEVAPPPTFNALARPGQVLLVDKPEQTQAQVRLGALGVKRGHVDHFPLVVMNAVLGGSFTSRLMRKIRVERGLTYGASSSFDMLSAGGAFTISSFTKTESVSELVDVALAEVARMKAEGPSPTELASVQRYICGLFPSRLETNEAIAGMLADVAHHSLPSTWISRYRENVMAVTVEEARRAASTYLFDGERVLVLVGNAQALMSQAERYGPVTVLEPESLA